MKHQSQHITAITKLVLVYVGTAAFLLQSILWPTNAYAHGITTPIIVDTDMAMDDVRALILLLKDPEFDIRAIVTSDGSLPPLDGATNVFRLLNAMNKTHIPVGVGARRDLQSPPWSIWARTLGWSDLPLPNPITIQPAPTLLSNAVATAPRPVTWLCLGPMSNLAEFIRRYPNLLAMIDKVYFYGTPPDVTPLGWNTAQDIESAKLVFASDLPITCVHLQPPFTLTLDSKFFDALGPIHTKSANLIKRLHSHPRMKSLIDAGHFRAWDDAVVLLLHSPDLAVGTRTRNGSKILQVEKIDPEKALRIYLQELRHDMGKLVMLAHFPIKTNFYHPDVAPYVHEIIHRYGEEEWILGVLASEMHGHLGLFSILGVKMGLRARQILGAERDQIIAQTLAGTNPPVSCLNDGIQFATGASLGRGTITVHTPSKPEPVGIFWFDGKKVTLKPKPEVLKTIQDKINRAAASYGTNSPEYFRQLRQISMEAWLSLDRNTIFEESLELEARSSNLN